MWFVATILKQYLGHEPRRRRPSSDICHQQDVWSSWPSNMGNTGDAEAHRPLAWRSARRYPGEKTFISIQGSRIWVRKGKGNQGRYRIIDCTTYIHHKYSSMSIIINHASIFHTICTLTCSRQIFVTSNSKDTYCYNPNNFLETSHLYFYRSASKTSMSCSSFLKSKCADSSQVSSLETCSLCDFNYPGLPMISSGYHGRCMSFSKISTINNCCLWRHKHVFKETRHGNT